MAESFADLISRVRADQELPSLAEEAVCQGVVLPVLAQLGWNPFDIREVTPQFSVGNGRVDYCLKVAGKNAVFVEVKRAAEDLEKHQEQLLQYAFHHGVELAVLTNGLAWWLYLPLLTGSWDERKFFAIDLQKQEVEAVTQHFAAFLGRGPVGDGSAARKARELLERGRVSTAVRRKIPQAWEELCREPDKHLVELLADRVERICGHRDVSEVENFLKHSCEPSSRQSEELRVPAGKIKMPALSNEDYTGKRAVAYTFRGKRTTVGIWKEILVGLAQTFYMQQPKDFFAKAQALCGRNKPYFAKDARGMENPRKIPGTDIYVETCFSAKDTVDHCRELMTIFGYRPEDLQVECEARR
jgi:hypothetical protein